MGCYYVLYLNTYGYSPLFYKGYHEEGECRQLEFWLEKEQILETYSAQLQTSWNFTEIFIKYMMNIGTNNYRAIDRKTQSYDDI